MNSEDTRSLIEREIDEKLKRLYELESSGRFRRVFAYALKITAATAGLLLTRQ